MYLYRTTMGCTVHAPAKLNLFFEVLGKRSDGYHEILTLMCPIALCDTVDVEYDPSGQITLTCRTAAGPSESGCIDVPEGRANLVYRAVELLRQRAGIAAGLRMRVVKRIPTAAGMGGGSSDAAAALAAANRAWGLDWPLAELLPLAAELGSDVPFFLLGGPAVCRGRGERVEPFAGVGLLWFVVVRPPAGLSTPAVYAACRPAESPQSHQPLLHALKRGEIDRAGRLLMNRLQPAASRLSPWIDRLQSEFAGLDVPGHGMTGSGTSYYGLCRHARHARRIARRLAARGVGSVFAVCSCR